MRRLSLLTAMVIAVATLAVSVYAADPRTMTFPPLTFDIPATERFTLPNGMVVHLYEDHELPIINVTAYIRTGSMYEPAEKSGLAALTSTLMRSGGTIQVPAEKLDEELEFMASSIDSMAGADVANVSMVSLRKNFERTLFLFGQVLMEPAFREDRVTLAKNRAIEGIRRQNDDPQTLADRELMKAIYAGHPLGLVPTADTVNSISRDDMVAFHRNYLYPNQVILAVSGDISQKELLTLLSNLFGGWRQEKVSLPKVPEPQSVKAEVLLVPRDISQSVVRMGHLGITKDNPDLYAIKVMDYILGGGFTSRLMLEVRTNQGLAYNVDSNFDVGRVVAGTFIAETETKTAATARTIRLIRDIIGGMTKEPVSERELSLAKDYIINSFMFAFAKPDAIANQRARLEYYDYPQGYLEQYRDKIAKVTRDDVLRVARKYLHPDRMVTVVVGNASKFDAPLKSFGAVRELKLETGR